MADSNLRVYLQERNCRVTVRLNYLSSEEQVALETECDSLPLIQHSLGVKWGRECLQPRLSMALGQPYRYSGKTHPAVQWTPESARLRDRINTEFGTAFNGGLWNVYRTGEDYISDHSDDESMLADNGAVYGISLTSERDMVLKWRDGSAPRIVIPLPPGSLFCMEGETQRHLTHGMPVRKRAGSRRSLTLRQFR